MTGFGDAENGDEKDHWIIEVVGDADSVVNSRIKSLTTKFRLRNVVSGCLLRSKNYFPGILKKTIVCQQNPDNYSSYNFWNIEEHVNPSLETGYKGLYRISFFSKFLETNKFMWLLNKELDSSLDTFKISSSPYEWPFLLKGIRITSWDNDSVKFYLFGNPIIWWGVSASLLVYAILLFVYIVRKRRGNVDFKNSSKNIITKDKWNNFLFGGFLGLIGWSLHYFPFFFMSRVT